ncbi:mechanosensitive ion channel family protein [Virgibacillus ihumii]|uniref:mechanosensitive ion channel family protein n=1 Tax=Virgibacillus ihumii TaxID=2686091 RepID=UPI0031B643F9
MDYFSDRVTNLWDYVTGPEFWTTIFQGIVEIIVIIVVAVLVIRIGSKLVDHLFEGRRQGPLRISERREKTLEKLITNTLKYTVYFTAFIMILDGVFKFEVGALLAGAGVAGLAIGFGAQSLVKDVISGFFIIFEDQFSVGDYIIASGVEGTVEEIGLRTSKIQSWTGELNVVPNGNITQVTNYSIYNGLAVIDINVPYESDVTVAEEIIEDVIQGLPDKYEEIVNTPIIHGVQTLDVSHYVIRVIADTLPVYQWAGARIIRKEVKERLYNEGIQIPAPRLVMYTRNQQPTSMEAEHDKSKQADLPYEHDSLKQTAASKSENQSEDDSDSQLSGKKTESGRWKPDRRDIGTDGDGAE